jgi:hypothetical protein
MPTRRSTVEVSEGDLVEWETKHRTRAGEARGHPSLCIGIADERDRFANAEIIYTLVHRTSVEVEAYTLLRRTGRS